MHEMYGRPHVLGFRSTVIKISLFFPGVVARHPDFTDYLREALTPEAVEEYLAHLFEDRTGPVESLIKRHCIENYVFEFCAWQVVVAIVRFLLEIW